MAVLAPVKRRLRRVLDRAAAPYVEELRSSLQSSATPHAPDAPPSHDSGTFQVPSDFFHGLLHELRTIELERVPKGAKRALSVGANGRWYFDWFEHSYGPLERHYGVEAYEPRPDDLPEYVEWIVNTADKMTGVEDSSVDLVFAGQTTEHLWADELAGFLLEAHRVLTDGGQLVLDSPNRLVTEHLQWSHGGHTVELSASEIAELLSLAGFEVELVHGLWVCVHDGRVLQLEERLLDAPLTTRRIALGVERPDDCFVWWVNARRLPVDVDGDALRRRIEVLYDQHWPLRVNRGIMANADDAVHPVAIGSHGVVEATLPFLLGPGSWQVGVSLARGHWSDMQGLRLDIVLPGDVVLHHLPMDSASNVDDRLTWVVEQPFVSFALSLRVMVDDVCGDVALALPIRVDKVG